MALVAVAEDFSQLAPTARARASRSLCSALERGDIIFVARTPVALGGADLSFLREQRQSGGGYHKNIAYRPREHRLSGYAGTDAERMAAVLERFSVGALAVLRELLAPYEFDVDFASFRPIEERNRPAKLHARNDLLHVDSFPTRPTHGRRILRFFVNIHPTRERVWKTGPAFPELARRYAMHSGSLERARRKTIWMQLAGAGGALGLPMHARPAYDRFMLSFHHWLKESSSFQSAPEHSIWRFPPMSSWMVFTDTVSHAVISGQYALEQTVLVKRESLVAPEIAPIAVVEQLMAAMPAGQHHA